MKKFIITLLFLASFSAQSQNEDYIATQQQALAIAGLAKYSNATNDYVIEKISSSIDNSSEILSDNYAGSWVEYDSNNIAYQAIAVTSLMKTASINEDYRIEYLVVNNSLKDLNKLQNNIMKEVSNKESTIFNKVSFITADPRENKISINIKEEFEDDIQKYLDTNNINKDLYQINLTSDELNLYADIYGGQKIVASNQNSLSVFRCTAGFTGSKDIFPIIITAGHCANQPGLDQVFFDLSSQNSPAIKGQFIGSFFENRYRNGTDVALFGNANWVHNLFPRIYINQNNTTVAVNSPSNPQVNSTVCTFGRTTGYRCGLITSVNTLVNAPGATLLVNFVRLCGALGDSGGPVTLANTHNAAGIFVGGLGGNSISNCGPTIGGGSGPLSIYTPITRILQLMPDLRINTF